ncbi:DsbA family protein [Variovorax sp. JS1663]|uniref:DsbA family protein n=1 Tax=Variovorax sp. JS1663 TaxID=1851577 RepID=UPI000B342B79|nr:DsbA family protein [Variovorax sp. JS1663]OUL99892.1 protein-disulfide isomerase [Variovorax sp. JS1663]
MPSTTIHYVFDPLCGWCYAAAPLVEAARRVPGLAIALHGGGMMTGPNRRPITAQWRNYVIPHDRRIAQLTGQPFGEAYFDGLLRDSAAVMDSEPPTTAILTAEALASRGLDLLHRLQRAHYVEGRRIADAVVLRELATGIGLDGDRFDAEYARQTAETTWQHIAASRTLLARAGGSGFPTFALDRGDGRLERLDASAWLGRPEAWQQQLGQQIRQTA